MTTLDSNPARLDTIVLDAFVAWTQQRRADAALSRLTEWVDSSLTTHGDESPYADRFVQRRNTPRPYVSRTTQGLAVLERRHPAAYRAAVGFKRPTLRSASTYHGNLRDRYAAEFVPALPLFTLPDRLDADAAIELRADLLRTRRTHKLAVDNAADVLADLVSRSATPLTVGVGTGFDVAIKRGTRKLDLDVLADQFPDVYASFVTEADKVTKISKPYTLVPRAASAEDDDDLDE